MQKKIALLLIVCSLMPLYNKSAAEDLSKKLIVINDPILHFIDGTPAVSISNIRYFGSECRKLQKGIPINKVMQGIIPFGNRLCTMQEMIDIENELEQNPNTELYEEYQKAFIFAADFFAEKSCPYIEEIQHIKNYLIKLIKTWSEQRKKPESILLNWSNIDGTDIHEIKKLISSFKKLDILISDLSIFLADLIISCPKSFIASFKDPKEGEVLLQKIRAQNGY